MVTPSNNWLDNYLGMLVYAREDIYLNNNLKFVVDPSIFHVFEIGIDGEIAKPGKTVNSTSVTCNGSEILKFVLCKIGVSTKLAVDLVEKALKSKVGYAGLKDSNAFTCQYISIKCKEGKRFRTEYELLNGAIRLYYYGKDILPLKRGDLEGNFFEIIFSYVDKRAREKLRSVEKALRSEGFPNFYGYQRFGSRRPVTHIIGKYILVGDYEKAVDWLLGHPFPGESTRAKRARRLYEEGKIDEAAKEYPPYLYAEKLVIEKLSKGTTPKEALNSLGTWYSRLFVEAYQSYLFNLALSEALLHEGSIETLSNKCEVFPIPHFLVSKKGACTEYIMNVVSREGLDRSLENSKLLHRGVREVSFKALSAKLLESEDLINLTFTLRPSVYATIILREMLRDKLLV